MGVRKEVDYKDATVRIHTLLLKSKRDGHGFWYNFHQHKSYLIYIFLALLFSNWFSHTAQGRAKDLRRPGALTFIPCIFFSDQGNFPRARPLFSL